MIVVESKRKKLSTLERDYPGAVIVDVTSHATGEMVRFSPFYPHGGIPVPYSGNMTSMSVEGIWQGLKVFGTAGVDRSSFRNATMKDLKRTTRRFGPTLGHRKGVDGTEFLGTLVPANGGGNLYLYALYGAEGSCGEENADLYWRLVDKMPLVFRSIQAAEGYTWKGAV